MEDCPECDSTKVKQKGEGKICGNCGLIVEEGGYFSGRMLLV